MKRVKNIIAITGARSEYDLLYSVYSKIHNHPDLNLKLIVTGPHLSEKYGLTIRQIENDPFEICDRIYNLIDSDHKIGRITSTGIQISQLAQSINRENPDLIIVAGDREEAISVTMVGAFLGIPVAHFFGGDIAKDGNIDNSIRYAASKFAHLHFTVMEEHKSNLLKLGEDEWRIHVVGNPALDRLIDTNSTPKNEVLKNLDSSDWENEKYCVLIQHSIITETHLQHEHFSKTLNGILKNNIKCFINYPNSDAGSDAIIKLIDEYAIKYPNDFRTFKNLNRDIYINLLRNAEFMIGNSSSGILEAPTLGLATINVGERQRGRIHGNNVIFVNNNESEISDAIQIVMHDELFKTKVKQAENPYGNGHSSSKIVDIISTLNIDDNLIYKNITY